MKRVRKNSTVTSSLSGRTRTGTGAPPGILRAAITRIDCVGKRAEGGDSGYGCGRGRENTAASHSRAPRKQNTDTPVSAGVSGKLRIWESVSDYHMRTKDLSQPNLLRISIFSL